jgi:KDO2-lipid IV(A) lauroyltransferase
MRHRLEARLGQAVFAALGWLGPARASDLGGAIARAIGPLLPVSGVAEANLRRALPALDAAARRAIIRAVWDNLGRTMAEFPHLPTLARTASGPGWEIVGEEIVRDLAATGGPVIFFSAHTGNWEMLPPIAAHFGIPLASFYRPLGNPYLDTRIAALRRDAIGREVVNFRKGAAGARAAFAHLLRDGYLGMLVDQKLNDGIAARLFGEIAMTAPAPATLALRFRCPVIPTRIERLGPARFRLVVEPALALPTDAERGEMIAALTQAINDRLEDWIRARPGEWLWLHRRWPPSPPARS